MAQMLLRMVEDAAPKEGYGKSVPRWRSKGHRRGRLGWGEMRDPETHVITCKGGAVPELCRATLLEAINYFMTKIGLPPVVAGAYTCTHSQPVITTSNTQHTHTQTGESLKKAVKEGRYVLADSPVAKRKPKGQTRGQSRLIRLKGDHEYDLRSVCVLVISAAYCQFIRGVPNESVAGNAVLGFINEHRVLDKILGNMKSKFERLGNRVYLQECAGGMHAWLREGSDEEKTKKMELLRSMGGDLKTDLEKHVGYRIIELLVHIARGRDPDPDKKIKRGYYPYGNKAAFSSRAFKLVPTPSLATSFTVVYPYLVREKVKWPELMKKYLHPMSSKGLWPVAVVNRYLSFFTLFRSARKNLFECYEAQGGAYHGAETVPRAAAVVVDVENLSTEDEDSVDADFV